MSVVWQRTVDPATPVWVRPDDAVAIGDDLADGATRGEPPWRFLQLQSWSRQHRLTGPAEATAWSDWCLALPSPS